MLSTKKYLSVILAISLMVEPCLGVPTAPPAPDPGWPRQVTNDQGTLIYYQPQIDSWNNYKDLVGRAAFSITPKSGKGTVGVVSFHADTDVNNDTRTVYLQSIDYTSVRFPY